MTYKITYKNDLERHCCEVETLYLSDKVLDVLKDGYLLNLLGPGRFDWELRRSRLQVSCMREQLIAEALKMTPRTR